MEAILLFLVAVAVIAISAVLFCIWLILTSLRALARALFGKQRRPVFAKMTAQPCNNRDCQCGNPSHARFCRRCGQPLPALMRLVNARAA